MPSGTATCIVTPFGADTCIIMPGGAPAGTSTANDAGWATLATAAGVGHATVGATLAIAARAGVSLALGFSYVIRLDRSSSFTSVQVIFQNSKPLQRCDPSITRAGQGAEPLPSSLYP